MRPIERQRLSDATYQHLLDELMAGRYEVGERLPAETALASRLEVSRPVVRAALQRLQQDGIVVSRQGSGTYVQRMPSSDLGRHIDTAKLSRVLQGFELRLVLEPLAARLAARHRSVEQLRLMEEADARMRGAMEREEVSTQEDLAFHHAIAAASGNTLLLETLEGLSQQLKAGIDVTLALTRSGTQQRQRQVLDEHRRILRAIRLSDPESAGIAMAFHLDQARNRLLDRQLDQ